MYKLLIFDWDGTVIDSAARIISSMQRSALDLDLAPLDAEAIRNIIGLGLPEAIRALVPGIDAAGIDAMRERYAHYYVTGDDTPTHLFAGARSSLGRLQRKGYRLAVATGKNRRGLDRVFAQTGLGSLFELSRCADETTSKPDPHMLHEILQQTGVDVSDALMVGDTEYDLEMGHRAGMATVAVSYGAHHIDRLKPWRPVLEIDNFPELEHWLDGQNKPL
ncbi:HAD-IA family hydrolase [Marinobacterium rhizophilum]|uniref:HAD-IA family hydrolase n=1 Tax=Marinobacterium rhizophilum TaxID=420402 RepID=A0ABY5HS22_9GAMM|nr:HAD-IA family hydrolase [Marinobacterium rhizophilum]UTW14358.1 HAD-IA family hydrolase [Marinobacterium rhizophilum]